MFNKPKHLVLFIVILGLIILIVTYTLTDQFINAGRLPQAEAFQSEQSPRPLKPKVWKSIVKLENDPKPPESSFPSEWGADDRRGAANRLTQQKVLEAATLIKTGEVYQLGRVYESGMPVFGTRHYSLRIPKISGPLGENKTTWFEEIFSGEIGQIVTRGVLIDVASYKDVEVLDDSYEITRADLEGALKKQNVEITPGDVVVIHTGWGKFWMTDNDRYSKTEPGIGLEAGQYLVDQKIVMACCDNWGIEVVPNPDESLAFPVHQLFIVKHGIYNLENIITEELAADKVYEFAFSFAPLRLKGASGSPGNPIAIR